PGHADRRAVQRQLPAGAVAAAQRDAAGDVPVRLARGAAVPGGAAAVRRRAVGAADGGGDPLQDLQGGAGQQHRRDPGHLDAAALALSTSAVFAQDRAAKAEKAKEKIEEKFKAADTNHDGKLSKDEAKGGMPKVYDHFDEIDTGKTGFVTLQQVEAEVAKMAK